MSLAIAILMWALVLSLSIRASKRSKNILLWCALLIASSLTTNVGFVYSALDAIAVYPNLVDLLSNLALIFGIYLLAVTIVSGARTASNGTPRGLKLELFGVVFVMVSMVVSFLMIEAPQSSTQFMLDYGGQAAAAFYSGIQYLYLSLIFLEALVTCSRALPQMTVARFRVGFSTIVVGCSFAVLLGVSVITMDILHLTNNLEVMKAVGGLYDVLRLGTVFFLCLGLSIPTLGKLRVSSRNQRRAYTLEPQLHELWAQTAGKHDSQSLGGESGMGGTPPMERLHRIVVEICDWSLREEGNSLSPSESALLSRAEALCMQEASA